MVCIQLLIRLRLDYMGLKKRLGGVPGRQKEGSQAGIR